MIHNKKGISKPGPQESCGFWEPAPPSHEPPHPHELGDAWEPPVPLLHSPECKRRVPAAPATGNPCEAAALDFLALGLSPLPLCWPHHPDLGSTHLADCAHQGKRPLLNWTEHMTRRAAEAEIRDWWRHWPAANVGCALGPVSGLIRLDLEGAEALEQLRRLAGGKLQPTWAFRSGRSSPGGFGILWSIPGGVTFQTTRQPLRDGELRFMALGSQTGLPPSLHVSGRRSAWLPGRSPWECLLAPAPTWAVERYGQGETGTDKPLSAGRRPRPAVAPPGAPIPEGSRDDTLTSLAGSMRRRGFGEEAILAALLAENSQRCLPPLPEGQVEKIARSIAKYSPAEDPLSPSGRGRLCSQRLGPPVPVTTNHPL
jgi:putative DNA primase/helicase